jgi:hypothetical protein
VATEISAQRANWGKSWRLGRRALEWLTFSVGAVCGG